MWKHIFIKLNGERAKGWQITIYSSESESEKSIINTKIAKEKATKGVQKKE